MKKCEITKRSSTVGGRYSNRTRATKYNMTGKVRRKINAQKRSLFVPEIGKNIRICISAKGLRECRKNGIYKTLKKNNVI